MGIAVQVENLKRFKEIAWLLIKYGNSDLIKNAGLEDVVAEEVIASGNGNGNGNGTVTGTHTGTHTGNFALKVMRKGKAPTDTSSEGEGHVQESTELPDKAEELTCDLERLGPTFVKLGQLLSTRPDFLPKAYLEALSRLQQNCEPFAFEEVEKIIMTELGVRLSKAFLSFDPKPLAAASLGQIHHAVMRDGREVAVKIQRPQVRENIVQDLDVLSHLADFYDAHTAAGKRYETAVMLEELRKSILAELDYRKEAHNLETLQANLQEFSLICVPTPVADYTTSKVLTMEFVKGKSISSVTPLALLEIDGAGLAEQVFSAYLKQILIDGFFHADPHPGNVFLTEDNRIALLDLGMVARLTPDLQGKLLAFLVGITEGRPDAVANVAVAIGDPKDSFDEPAFRKQITDLVQQYEDTSIQDLQIGKLVLNIVKAAGDCGIRIPAELTMLGKTLLNLDQVGRILNPSFNPNASVRRSAGSIMKRKVLKGVSPGHLFSALMESKDFLETLPARINKIMDLLAHNKLKVEVDTIDETVLVDAFQKVANRITLGLVLAALIMGASMLMRVPSAFTILGYPGLAIICFVCAAGGGFALVMHIAIYDQKAKKFDS